VDNLTHTLVGAALAESGLKRRTALASATLMIGANFPDIDVVAVAFDNSTHWRRGHTHGFLALAILPFVLAWIMRTYDRRVRMRRHPDAAPADFRQLCILSALAIFTHPTLDFMNTYGMRWLMPFVNKWFYADGLFIVEPVLIFALGVGVYWSRRGRTVVPATVALAFLVIFTVGMLGITSLGRRAVARQYPGLRAMVAPSPGVPWVRNVIVDADSVYVVGRWSPRRGLVSGDLVAKGDDHPAAALARQNRDVQRYLIWARFPYYRVDSLGNSAVVRIVDARYDATWASISVQVPSLP
jgi:inner membrane protein